MWRKDNHGGHSSSQKSTPENIGKSMERLKVHDNPPLFPSKSFFTVTIADLC